MLKLAEDMTGDVRSVGDYRIPGADYMRVCVILAYKVSMSWRKVA